MKSVDPYFGIPVFSTFQTIQDVLEDFQANRKEYTGYHARDCYVVDWEEKLVGALRIP